jgi:ethanolamine utilization protein EutS
MDMNLLDIGASAEGKLRIIQETVPGKQVTLAHIIASPGEIIYQKLGLNPEIDYQQSAIGILSMCPSEVSVIAGDIALKTSSIEIGFIDRFSGTLIFTGRISNVQSAVSNILAYLKNRLGFTVCEITRT